MPWMFEKYMWTHAQTNAIEKVNSMWNQKFEENNKQRIMWENEDACRNTWDKWRRRCAWKDDRLV